MTQLEYTDGLGYTYELKPEKWEKGDRACSGCAFKFGNSAACLAAPTCTPNTNYKKEILIPEWVGKHLVWKQKKMKK